MVAKIKSNIKIMFMYRFIILMLLLLCSFFGYAVSDNCKFQYPQATQVAAMYDLAVLVTDAVDNVIANKQVLVIARSGQDLSQYGLKHSHVGFLLADANKNLQVIHLLNKCSSSTSNLYQEGLVNFIADTAQNSNGLRIAILNKQISSNLIKLLQHPATQAKALHQQKYNLIAYPFNIEFQNSNGWVLEVIAAAMALNDGVVLNNRTQSINFLQHNGYKPSLLDISIIKRLAARLVVENANTKDHPLHERISGNYSVVTAESIFAFLYEKNLLEQELNINLAL